MPRPYSGQRSQGEHFSGAALLPPWGHARPRGLPLPVLRGRARPGDAAQPRAPAARVRPRRVPRRAARTLARVARARHLRADALRVLQPPRRADGIPARALRRARHAAVEATAVRDLAAHRLHRSRDPDRARQGSLGGAPGPASSAPSRSARARSARRASSSWPARPRRRRLRRPPPRARRAPGAGPPSAGREGVCAVWRSSRCSCGASRSIDAQRRGRCRPLAGRPHGNARRRRRPRLASTARNART